MVRKQASPHWLIGLDLRPCLELAPMVYEASMLERNELRVYVNNTRLTLSCTKPLVHLMQLASMNSRKNTF